MRAATAMLSGFVCPMLTCTALQLANFWQDVRVDWQKGRVYLPLEDMQRFGVDEQTIAAGVTNNAFRSLLREEVAWARELFAEGMPLLQQVDKELALDLDLFSRGGLEILSAIEHQDYDVLRARPSISKSRKVALLLRALTAKFVPGFARGRTGKRDHAGSRNGNDSRSARNCRVDAGA